LNAEALEDRTVPTALGSPWPAPESLTLSFAPDGTRVGDSVSNLTGLLGSAGSTAEWQREILRAFQTWAVHTNANIGLVADGGAAFGTPGHIEGDFRFGDIRIGSLPLSNDSLANGSAFDWRIGTWSGDVLFNSRFPFAIDPSSPTTAADLFTVALHEAGHVFGMTHSDDPRSPLFEAYTGAKTGLTAADIAALQSFYGTRQADEHEGRWGNDSFWTATPVDALTGAARLTADIGANDTDTYSLLNTSLLGTLAVKVKTSGISLLQAKVSVYDSWGRLLASKTASGPGQDVELELPRSLLNLGYRVRVTGATDGVFGIGGYEMSVVRTDGLGLILPPCLTETLASSSLLGAVLLLALGSSEAGRESFGAEAKLDHKSDVDYFSVRVPATTDANDRAMVVSVVHTGGKSHPDLAVFDAQGRPVDVHVLNNDGSTLSLQVLGIARGETYFLRVSHPTSGDSTGRYRVTAEFQPPADNHLRMLDAGRVDADRPAAGGTLTVNAARLFQFSFSSTSETAGAAVSFTLRDAAGNVLLTLSKGAADPAVNQSLYLEPGDYSLEVHLSVPPGTPAEVEYRIDLGIESGPVGPYTPGSAGSPSDPGSNSGPYTYSQSPPSSQPEPVQQTDWSTSYQTYGYYYWF
jgi:hypothetical protein